MHFLFISFLIILNIVLKPLNLLVLVINSGLESVYHKLQLIYVFAFRHV